MRNDILGLRFIFIAGVLLLPGHQSGYAQNFGGGGGFNNQTPQVPINQNMANTSFANKPQLAPMNPSLNNSGFRPFGPGINNFGRLGGGNFSLQRQNSGVPGGHNLGPLRGANAPSQGPNSLGPTVNQVGATAGMSVPVHGRNSFFLPGDNLGPLAGINLSIPGSANFQPQPLNQAASATGGLPSNVHPGTVMTVRGNIGVQLAPVSSSLPSGFVEIVPVSATKTIMGAGSLVPAANGPLHSFQFGNIDAAVTSANNAIITVDHERAHLILFSSANQVLCGAKGQKLIGKPGTVISRKRSVVLLHSGALVAHSGQNHLEIETAQGIIDMPENSNAVIELEPGRPLRVIPLNTTVSVRGVINAPNHTLHATVGEELIVAEKDDAELDLIPVDGLSRTVITGGIERIGGLKRSSAQLPSGHGAVHAKPRTGRVVRLAGGTMEDKTQSILSQIAPNWKFGSCSSGSQADGTPLQFVVAPNSKFECSAGDGFKLIEGVALLAAPSPVTIGLPIGQVMAAKGVVMMIESHSGIFRVKAFNSVGDVKVAFHDQMVPLNGGEELVLADHLISSESLNPGDYIARRPSASINNLNGLTYTINEFSITSFLKIRPCYESLQNLDSHRQLMSAVLKAAVVVDMVKRGHGQYVYGETESRLAAK